MKLFSPIYENGYTVCPHTYTASQSDFKWMFYQKKTNNKNDWETADEEEEQSQLLSEKLNDSRDIAPATIFSSSLSKNN